MKKALSIFTVSILFSTLSFGQLEKSSWLIGGSGSFSGGFNKNASSFGMALQPRVGFFVANKFAVGSGLGFAYQSLRQQGNAFWKGTSVGLSPFARYYFLNRERKFNLFAEAGFDVSQSWVTSNNSIQNRLSLTPTASFGAVYFIRPQIGIEARLVANSTFLNPNNTNTGMRLGGLIGFQIHLNKPKAVEESVVQPGF